MADQLLTTPEAGRLLGMEPEDIYRVIDEEETFDELDISKID